MEMETGILVLLARDGILVAIPEKKEAQLTGQHIISVMKIAKLMLM